LRRVKLEVNEQTKPAKDDNNGTQHRRALEFKCRQKIDEEAAAANKRPGFGSLGDKEWNGDYLGLRLLTILRWTGAGRGVAAQVVAGVGVLVHGRERVAEGTARTREAGVLAALRSEMLIGAPNAAVPGIGMPQMHGK